MKDLYYYETIEEYEKDIMDKCIILDIMHSNNANLIGYFNRAIKIPVIFIFLLSLYAYFIVDNNVYHSGLLLGSCIVLSGGYILLYYIKFIHHRNYSRMKIEMIGNMLDKCKEYQENNFEEWQKTQMLKRFAALANINLDVNSDNSK